MRRLVLASETAFNTMRIRWRDNVAQPKSLPTQYDNDFSFTQPQNKKWAKITIIINATVLKEISAYRVRHTGLMIAGLHDDLGAGDKELLALFDFINPFFRNRIEGGITWYQPTLVRVGTDGQWYRLNVNMPFHFDEFHT